MAKLFEEVLSGACPTPSADVLVHFAPSPLDLALGSPSPLSGSSPRAGNAVASLPAAAAVTAPSPRGGGALRSREACDSSASPVRLAPAGDLDRPWGDSRALTTLRLHTLMLRTQPSLMQALLPPRRSTGGALEEDGSLDVANAEAASSSSSTAEGELTPMCVDCNIKMHEVTVTDEPEVFLEVIKFVYLNTCHVDQSNVKSLILVADKYGIEDIVRNCLQWFQGNFTANMFYHFLTFQLSNDRFQQLLRLALLRSTRSRRAFALITGEDADGRWEHLPVPFMASLLSSDELPVVSEIEVFRLVARWSAGVLSRQDRDRCSSPASTVDDSGDQRPPLSPPRGPQAQADIADADAACGKAAGAKTPDESSGSGGLAESDATSGDCSPCGSRAPAGRALRGRENIDDQRREEMLGLLKSFRRSEGLTVQLSELEPVLQLLRLNGLFSTKPPRAAAALDPGFTIYRGVAGVNVPTPFGGGLHNPKEEVVAHAWKGGSVSLGSRDFLKQQDGFLPGGLNEGPTVFQRLRVRIECPSWSHREKRMSKSTPTSAVRHTIAGPIGGTPVDAPGLAEAAPWTSMGLYPSVGDVSPPVPPAPTLKFISSSQDDWELSTGRSHARAASSGQNLPPLQEYDIGRRSGGRTWAEPPRSQPNLSDHETIHHKVICAVTTGHVRHGIRIGQRERSSIYEIEDLYGSSDEVCLGGTPTEVDFELQLTADIPNHCGICRCALALLPVGPFPDSAQSGCNSTSEPLMEIIFDASAEERLHFHVSSSSFDSNSSYSVALNWVLR